MIIGLLSLPLNAINKICGILTEHSLLQIRLISHATKKVVDNFMVMNTRENILKVFKITLAQKKNETIMCIIFYQNSRHTESKTKLHFLQVLNKFPRNVELVHEKLLRVTMNHDEVKIFLKYLKLFIQKTRLYQLSVSHDEPEIINILTTFLEGIQIGEIYLRDLENSTLKSLLDLSRTVCPKYIYCNIPSFTYEMISFMLQIATLAKTIEIFVRGDGAKMLRDNIISIVQGMMSTACTTLVIEGSHSPISLTIAENIVQYFHHFGMKVHFQTTIHANTMEAQIGEYTMKVLEDNDRDIRIFAIKHLQMK